MRKILLTAAVTLLGAASLPACSTMDSARQGSAPTPSGASVSDAAYGPPGPVAPPPSNLPH